MADNPTSVSRRELEAMIVKRCLTDTAFRAAFTSDPAGTLAAHLGVAANRLPPIVVHEEQPGTWHLVLPPPSASAGGMSNAELDKVSGGVDYRIEYDGVADFPRYPANFVVDFDFLKNFK